MPDAPPVTRITCNGVDEIKETSKRTYVRWEIERSANGVQTRYGPAMVRLGEPPNQQSHSLTFPVISGMSRAESYCLVGGQNVVLGSRTEPAFSHSPAQALYNPIKSWSGPKVARNMGQDTQLGFIVKVEKAKKR